MNKFSKSLWGSRAAMLAVLGLVAVPADADLTNVTYKAEATVKETYDSNVYLQDNAPNPANVAAAQAAGLTAGPGKQRLLRHVNPAEGRPGLQALLRLQPVAGIRAGDRLLSVNSFRGLRDPSRLV